MAVDFLSPLVQFVLKYKFVLGFYFLIILLVYLNRKKFQFQLKVIAIYRTRLGLRLMDRISSRYRELVKLFGYIGVGVGFIGMLFIVFVLGQSVVTLLTVPNSPSPLSPVIPGVRIPGVAAGFFVPFVQGIIAIFIVAVVHEFAHGVVARAHNVKVLSSGPAIIGPIFAAFVEPDEKQIMKKDDIVNYSIFSAGTFSNVVLAAVILFLLSTVFTPASSAFFTEQGVVLNSVEPNSPAAAASMYSGMAIKSIDNTSVRSVQDVLNVLQSAKPNQTAVFSDGQKQYPVTAVPDKQSPQNGHFGIVMQPVYKNGNTPYFKAFSWLQQLLALTATLSLGIGLANMIPVGPLDGGKMLSLALKRISPKKGNRATVIITVLLLFVILFLLSPIFKAIFKSIAGI